MVAGGPGEPVEPPRRAAIAAVSVGPTPPGAGWPGDPASALTPLAHDAVQVAELAASAGTLTELLARQSVCRACPRLVAWREEVALRKRPSSRGERYWGRPVPGWGDERPPVLIVGLAPAAHGGNRTGRIFTGDRSGDVLFASLHRCGFAALATSLRAGDGQRLSGARVVAAVRCAPPANKPEVEERDTCAPWLDAEFAAVRPSVRVVVCLGGFAWQATWRMLRSGGLPVPRPRPAFGHGVEVVVPGPAVVPGPVPALSPGVDRPTAAPGPLLVMGCYHPSQQNTFTGRVTPAMLDAVFTRARAAAGLPATPVAR